MPHVRSKKKQRQLAVRDHQESISAKSISLRMPSDSNDESEDRSDNKAEKEEAKTKPEFLTVPDKVTHNTVGRTKNKALGNFNSGPNCNDLQLEALETENIGPLETEAAFNNEQDLVIDLEFEDAFQDDNENKDERMQIQIEEIDKEEQASQKKDRDKDNDKQDQEKDEGKNVSENESNENATKDDKCLSIIA